MTQRLFAAALLGFLTLAASSEARAESWVEVASPAFTVLSDGSEKEARRVAAQFEQIRALLKAVWPWARFAPPRPVTILAVRNERGLRGLLPEPWETKGAVRPDGIFVRSPQRCWVALRMDVAQFREGDDTWDNPYLILFHEYVHLVLDLNFERLPVWLNEGLAEYWGSTIIQDDRVYIGQPIRHHLLALRRREPTPLARLFAVTHDSAEYSEENRASLFYAQSWALIHYLALGSQDRRGQLDRFARLLLEDRSEEEAVAEVFGDLGALQEEMDSYVRRFRFHYERRSATITGDTSEFTVRPLGEAESLAIRAAFHVAMNRPMEARVLAEKALALEPDLSAAHEALGLMAWREDRIDEAAEAVRRAAGLPNASDFAHYLDGRLRWQQLTGQEGLEAVEAAFRRAIELNPSFADAYSRLAQVMDARGAPLEHTLAQAMKAAQIEPGNVKHLIAALRLAGRRGERKRALEKAEALRARLRGSDRDSVEHLITELSLPVRIPPEAASAPASGHSSPGLILGEDRASAPSPEDRPLLTVVVDFVVEDSSGRPVLDLEPPEIEVVHGAEKQRIDTLEHETRAGHYRVRYTPFSGEPGAVYVRCLRPGTHMRAPEGAQLKPRLVTGPSAQEVQQDAELDAALAEGPADFSISVAVHRFEASAAGVHHTVAVELPLWALPEEPGVGIEDGRLRILARLKGNDGGAVHRLAVDRSIVIPPHIIQDLVWCGDVHLPAGRYQLDMLVREATAGRSATRSLALDVPEPDPGLRMSSVLLLQPRDATIIREGGEDDPLFFEGEPVMPKLEVALPIGSGAPIRFFVVVYPDPESEEPTSLDVELLHEEQHLGRVPISLPPRDARGEIRYVGLLATESFQGRPYTLRLVARQGDSVVSAEAAFEMRP